MKDVLSEMSISMLKLTSTMNKFELSVSESVRAINALKKERKNHNKVHPFDKFRK